MSTNETSWQVRIAVLEEKVSTLTNAIEKLTEKIEQLHGLRSLLNPKTLAILLPLLGVGVFSVDKAYHKASPDQEKYIHYLEQVTKK